MWSDEKMAMLWLTPRAVRPSPPEPRPGPGGDSCAGRVTGTDRTRLPPTNMARSRVDDTPFGRSFSRMKHLSRGSAAGQVAVARGVRAAHAGRPFAALPLAALLLVACGGNDGVTIRGDVAGLDTLALRGDALIAEANRAPMVIDSLRVASQEEIKRQLAESLAVIDPTSRPTAAAGSAAAAAVTNANPGTSAGGIMSRRAQARGDSMAKAFAAKLTGSGAAERARGDSVRGVLVWQGTEPARIVVLRSPTGTVTLSGMATTGLGRLVGSEVVVRGVRISPRDLVVAEYFVRAADGVPAYDGVILENGSLRMSDGSGVKRVPIPIGMQGMIGARVWVAPQDGKPQAYGLIQAR